MTVKRRGYVEVAGIELRGIAASRPDPGESPTDAGWSPPLAHPVGVNLTAGSGWSGPAIVHALAHAEVGDPATPKPAATTKVSSRSATA